MGALGVMLVGCRVCTWLSFDGGFTWSDIAEGTWIYEYADWGGVVVMSKHELNGPADEVRQPVWSHHTVLAYTASGVVLQGQEGLLVATLCTAAASCSQP
jgi:hypothetical protein